MSQTYTNAKVFLGTGENDFAEAFTVDGDRFSWVGAAADVADADAVDLGGATVLPGFLDVHMHPSMLAELVDSVQLFQPKVLSVADLLDTLRAHPNVGKGPDAWIEGYGYNESKYPEGTPTRHDLDQVATDQPVFCLRSDVHTAVCNTFALEQAGIDKDTPDPEGARFEREEDGTPNGVMVEFDAYQMVTAKKPAADQAEWVRKIVALNEQFGRLGLTTVDDLLATYCPNTLDTFRKAVTAGYYPNTGLMLQYSPGNMPTLSEEDRTGQVRVAGVKLIMDGAYSNRTAWTLDPYPGTSDEFGLSTLSADDMIAGVEWARDNKVQACIHAMGDRAIKVVLDTFEDWEPWLGDDKPSIRIEHSTLFSEEMIDQAEKATMNFGIISHTIFFFAEYDNYEDNLSEKQFDIAYPIKSFYDKLTFTALASDSPATAWVDAHNPFFSVQAAVDRRAYNGADIGQPQAIRVGQALELYAHRAAACDTAKDVGTIEPGKEANFVILDQDVFTVPTEDIGKTTVEQTWMRGAKVWSK